jgi:hypothetical protein
VKTCGLPLFQQAECKYETVAELSPSLSYESQPSSELSQAKQYLKTVLLAPSFGAKPSALAPKVGTSIFLYE